MKLRLIYNGKNITREIIYVYISCTLTLLCACITMPAQTEDEKGKENIVAEKETGMKIVVNDKVPGYTKVTQFFDQKGNPVVNGAWGHECREKLPDANGIIELSFWGIDGELQHPETHTGLCLPFVCRDHFDKSRALKIRLSAAPVIIEVSGAAKMGLYGQIQRIYDRNGNELVLNTDSPDGYKLFLVSTDKKVLCKYYLRNGSTLRNGPEGYAYVHYTYNKDGKKVEERRFGLNGEQL